MTNEESLTQCTGSPAATARVKQYDRVRQGLVRWECSTCIFWRGPFSVGHNGEGEELVFGECVKHAKHRQAEPVWADEHDKCGEWTWVKHR